MLQEKFGDRLRLIWGNFALLYKILKKEGICHVDGILADFGPSTIQLKNKAGFSFASDTLLDMRMSPAHQKTTAQEIINTATEKKLRDIFWEFGEEPFAKHIARAIVMHRKQKNQTTAQLAQLIETIKPKRLGKKIHPATKVFQALRIYINKELENISAFLASALDVLKPGGRLVCISFHSLEDRLVKRFFNQHERMQQLTVLTPKVVTATEVELLENPSSRSARLRAAQMM